MSESQLVFAKGRVAPLQKGKSKSTNEEFDKRRSIPQLELLGVTIGKRAITSMSLNLRISRTIIWTDATTILQWLCSSHIQPQFVQNRINELRNAVDITFRYTPTQDNPADILSRGQRASILNNNDLWWKGPSWLPIERLWPVTPLNVSEYVTSSARIVLLCSKHNMVSTPLLTNDFENRYSFWPSYIYCILRLPFLAKKYAILALSSSEKFKRAEYVIRLIQQKYFSRQLTHLQAGDRIHSDLQLFLHTDGIIRCRARMENAPLDWDITHPIYLPRESQLVRVLILYIHMLVGHSGTEVTLGNFRTKYWITKSRSLVDSVIHRCSVCRNGKEVPFNFHPSLLY